MLCAIFQVRPISKAISSVRPHREELSSHARLGAKPAHCSLKNSAPTSSHDFTYTSIPTSVPSFRGLFNRTLGRSLPQEPLQNLFIMERGRTLEYPRSYSDSVFSAFPLLALSSYSSPSLRSVKL